MTRRAISTTAGPGRLADLLLLPEGSAAGAPLLVLLHGRGAHEGDLASLSDWLPGHMTVALPRAPFPAAPWGYGPGWAWYQFLGGARPEPESFRTSQAALTAWLDELNSRLPEPPGALVLGGFSQGGTMSLAWALDHPGRAAGVMMLSGFLAEHPDVRVTGDNAGALEIFWGHGTLDQNIPHRLGEAGREALRSAGARVEARDYPMAHSISRDEIADLSAWLRRLTDGPAAPPGAWP